MTSKPDNRVTLEAIDRIVGGGGDADQILRDVVALMRDSGIPYAAIRFVEEGVLVGGPTAGERVEALAVPVVYQGETVGELEAAVDDDEFLTRVATLISAFVLVGWDTGGEEWRP